MAIYTAILYSDKSQYSTVVQLQKWLLRLEKFIRAHMKIAYAFLPQGCQLDLEFFLHSSVVLVYMYNIYTL